MFVVSKSGLEGGRGNTDVGPRFGGRRHITAVDDVRGEALVVKWAIGRDTAIANSGPSGLWGGVNFPFVGGSNVLCDVRCSGIGKFDSVFVKDLVVTVKGGEIFPKYGEENLGDGASNVDGKRRCKPRNVAVSGTGFRASRGGRDVGDFVHEATSNEGVVVPGSKVVKNVSVGREVRDS
jgi:hypothetical protein